MADRDREILGAPKYSSLDDVPICKGNSRICNFISCAAHNFKNDQSFANINLATQVLADSKLRKAISKLTTTGYRDPDALSTVCHEQGLSGPQCRLFQKGFQLIDKFISTIEPAESSSKQTNQVVQEEDDFYTDEIDDPLIPIRPVTGFIENQSRTWGFPGSRTWSSHPEPAEPIQGYHLPQDPMRLATFPPLLFTLPPLPTLPALASLISPIPSKDPISPLTSFSFDSQLLKHSIFDRNAKQIYPRLMRIKRAINEEERRKAFDNTDIGWIRQKRHSDYYEDLENEPVTERPKSSDKTEHLYYDVPVDNESELEGRERMGSGILTYWVGEHDIDPMDAMHTENASEESKALSFFSSFIRDNKMITSVMDMVRRLSNNRPPHAYPTKAHPVKRYSTTQLRLSNSDTPRQLGPARDFKASLRLDQPIKSPTHTGNKACRKSVVTALKNLHALILSASQKSLRNEAWAETLFGPQGVLTAIFHMIDDRQKGKEPSEGGTHPIETNPTNAQYDLPFFIDMDFFKNAKPIDFAKIFQALVTNSQGDFEDPIAELPGFMGLCNRLSCGDIYKAIDQFRKSEFFSNFQTAMQLIQDPKGWEIIGDLLSNPDLIAQFTGGSGGLEKLLGSAASSVSSQTKIDKTSKARRPSTDVGPGDGDLGTDFSEMINERKPNKEKKPTAEELPEIAENVDETDYYNAIESGIDELEQIGGEIETVEKPDEIAPSLSKNINGEKKGEQLPQILESIDESEKTSIRIDGTDTLVIDKNGFNGGIATKT
uniref:Uncharacterized protein n=1 Tax=Parascaris univalens TaxID=6257 RepID=A0A915AKP0_PARUN